MISTKSSSWHRNSIIRFSDLSKLLNFYYQIPTAHAFVHIQRLSTLFNRLCYVILLSSLRLPFPSSSRSTEIKKGEQLLPIKLIERILYRLYYFLYAKSIQFSRLYTMTQNICFSMLNNCIFNVKTSQFRLI